MATSLTIDGLASLSQISNNTLFLVRENGIEYKYSFEKLVRDLLSNPVIKDNLGSNESKFKDLYLEGSLNISSLNTPSISLDDDINEYKLYKTSELPECSLEYGTAYSYDWWANPIPFVEYNRYGAPRSVKYDHGVIKKGDAQLEFARNLSAYEDCLITTNLKKPAWETSYFIDEIAEKDSSKKSISILNDLPDHVRETFSIKAQFKSEIHPSDDVIVSIGTREIADGDFDLSFSTDGIHRIIKISGTDETPESTQRWISSITSGPVSMFNAQKSLEARDKEHTDEEKGHTLLWDRSLRLGTTKVDLDDKDLQRFSIATNKAIKTYVDTAKEEAIGSSKVTLKKVETPTSMDPNKYYFLYSDSDLQTQASSSDVQIQNNYVDQNAYIERGSEGETTLVVTYVENSTGNDVADYLPIEEGAIIQYGRVYTRDPSTKKVRLAKKGEKAIGIASDTCGIKVGKNPKESQVPIAIGGWVLAYVDKEYKPGTLLKIGEKGILTKASKFDQIFNSFLVVASYDRIELSELWHGKEVDGRHWVKVR